MSLNNFHYTGASPQYPRAQYSYFGDPVELALDTPELVVAPSLCSSTSYPSRNAGHAPTLAGNITSLTTSGFENSIGQLINSPLLPGPSQHLYLQNQPQAQAHSASISPPSVHSASQLSSASTQGSGQVHASQYLLEILAAADQHKLRQKRIRFDDMGASPRKRAKLTSGLEDKVFADQSQDEVLSDGDLLKLQMLALASLKQEKQDLLAVVEKLEADQTTLLELNREQTEQRLHVLKVIVMQRGIDLKNHGDFLIQLAEKEISLIK